MFKVRTSVKQNVLTIEELADIGVTPEAIAEAVSSSPCAWVAEVDTELVGFAMVDLETACLFAAFVLPSHEDKGIGRALLAACENALFARHAEAWLETARSSRAAGFYRHFGWGFETDAGGGDIRLHKRRS